MVKNFFAKNFSFSYVPNERAISHLINHYFRTKIYLGGYPTCQGCAINDEYAQQTMDKRIWTSPSYTLVPFSPETFAPDDTLTRILTDGSSFVAPKINYNLQSHMNPEKMKPFRLGKVNLSVGLGRVFLILKHVAWTERFNLAILVLQQAGLIGEKFHLFNKS